MDMCHISLSVSQRPYRLFPFPSYVNIIEQVLVKYHGILVLLFVFLDIQSPEYSFQKLHFYRLLNEKSNKTLSFCVPRCFTPSTSIHLKYNSEGQGMSP